MLRYCARGDSAYFTHMRYSVRRGVLHSKVSRSYAREVCRETHVYFWWQLYGEHNTLSPPHASEFMLKLKSL